MSQMTWNNYIKWLSQEIDLAIVEHYEATLKVQNLRERLHEARHEMERLHEARHEEARKLHEARRKDKSWDLYIKKILK